MQWEKQGFEWIDLEFSPTSYIYLMLPQLPEPSGSHLSHLEMWVLIVPWKHCWIGEWM